MKYNMYSSLRGKTVIALINNKYGKLQIGILFTPKKYIRARKILKHLL